MATGWPVYVSMVILCGFSRCTTRTQHHTTLAAEAAHLHPRYLPTPPPGRERGRETDRGDPVPTGFVLRLCVYVCALCGIVPVTSAYQL